MINRYLKIYWKFNYFNYQIRLGGLNHVYSHQLSYIAGTRLGISYYV
jgi:hypothetical protein